MANSPKNFTAKKAPEDKTPESQEPGFFARVGSWLGIGAAEAKEPSKESTTEKDVEIKKDTEPKKAEKEKAEKEKADKTSSVTKAAPEKEDALEKKDPEPSKEADDVKKDQEVKEAAKETEKKKAEKEQDWSKILGGLMQGIGSMGMEGILMIGILAAVVGPALLGDKDKEKVKENSDNLHDELVKKGFKDEQLTAESAKMSAQQMATLRTQQPDVYAKLMQQSETSAGMVQQSLMVYDAEAFGADNLGKNGVVSRSSIIAKAQETGSLRRNGTLDGLEVGDVVLIGKGDNPNVGIYTGRDTNGQALIVTQTADQPLANAIIPVDQLSGYIDTDHMRGQLKNKEVGQAVTKEQDKEGQDKKVEKIAPNVDNVRNNLSPDAQEIIKGISSSLGDFKPQNMPSDEIVAQNVQNVRAKQTGRLAG